MPPAPVPFAPAPLLLTTGPVAVWPDVLHALSRPIRFDLDPAFQAFYETVARRAQVALGSALPPVIVQGEAVLALEAAVASLVGRNDRVLSLVNGAYGGGLASLARRQGANVIELRVPSDQPLDPDEVRARLRDDGRITVVTLCHLDTPSGTVNPADEIGAVVAAHGALLLVDAVSSWAGMSIDPVSCRADLFITGPNKCLGGPPGLSLVAVSPAGWERIRANPTAPRGSVLSLLDWEIAWQADQAFPFTPSIAEIHALDAALALHAAEGAAEVRARHARTARMMRAGSAAMGLSTWPRPEGAADSVTVLRAPKGVDAAAWLEACRTRFNLVLAPGRGETEGKVVRVGHMGPAAQPMHALMALAALGGAAATLGVPLAVGRGVEAALAAIDDPPLPSSRRFSPA